MTLACNLDVLSKLSSGPRLLLYHNIKLFINHYYSSYTSAIVGYIFNIFLLRRTVINNYNDNVYVTPAFNKFRRYTYRRTSSLLFIATIFFSAPANYASTRRPVDVVVKRTRTTSDPALSEKYVQYYGDLWNGHNWSLWKLGSSGRSVCKSCLCYCHAPLSLVQSAVLVWFVYRSGQLADCSYRVYLDFMHCRHLTIPSIIAFTYRFSALK